MRATVIWWGAFALALCPAPGLAQAWTPPAGSGTVSVSFQAIVNTGHRLSDGTYIDNGRSRSHGLYVEADVGLTRRWAITAGLPFVLAKYTDDDAPPPFLPFLPVDQCRCWHGGWQDVSFGTRFSVVDTFDHITQVALSAAAGIPSHAYDYRGEAVVGRRLKEARFGVDAARRLVAISPRLSVSGRYSYAVVERVLGLPNNRSNATVEVGYRLSPAASVRGFVSWQRTHGGLRAGSLPGSSLPGPGDLTSADRIAEHDRLLRDNRVHAGVGVLQAIARADVFATFTYFVSGTDSHAGYALTGGVNVPFRIRP